MSLVSVRSFRVRHAALVLPLSPRTVPQFEVYVFRAQRHGLLWTYSLVIRACSENPLPR